MPSTCVTCLHSQRDHAIGRCVNARMAFVPAVGGTVSVRCECKRYAVTDALEAPVSVEYAPVAEVAEAVVSEPRRRGRKPLPRDAEGDIIRADGDTGEDEDE